MRNDHDRGPADAADSESRFEGFTREILAQASSEDRQGLWEPVWWLRGGGAIAGQTEADRHAFAERALRELQDEGSIFFFRLRPGADINASALDPRARLTPNEIDAALRSSWWREAGGLDTAAPLVWWGPTSRGETASRVAEQPHPA